METGNAVKIHHSVQAIADPASGLSHSVPALCRELARIGHEVELHTLEPAPPASAGGYRLRAHPRSGAPRMLGISPAMKATLRSAARTSDVMHTHGLWMMPNIYPARAVRGTSCRLVLSPRGMLDPWAWEHHRMRKRIVWLAGQRANLAEAACIHATAEQEYDFTRRVGVTAPVAIIPNGVPIPEVVPAAREAKHRRLLFLARIHEKKGVDVLLRAWCAVEHRFPDWELRIVGPDDGGHLPRMQALARQLGVERVTFAGRVPEERKGDEYREAEIYVLPTENENWGVSIADALALGVPAIVTKGAPWSGLETHECGWWIDKSVDALADCLDEALRCPPEDLRRRGARGRAWMERDYAWSRIGEMMDRTYRWLLEGGSPPAWVATD